MNEAAQIHAMVAELLAEGYNVAHDFSAKELGSHWPKITLDLIAWPPSSNPLETTLVIEIANRRERPGSESQTDEPDEEKAVERFNGIAGAIRKSKRPIEFQIRFFDVSADQAFARTLVGTSVFNAESVASQFDELKTALDNEALGSNSRALFVAHEWARWLRMAAYRWPGFRREMPFADLRKIQKDLFDVGVITTPPGKYYRTHQSILAAVEGGDVEWDRLEALEGDLLAVASRITDYVTEVAEKPTPAPAPRRKRPDKLFERIENTLREQFPPRRGERLLTLLRGLRDTDGSARYTDALGKFVAEIGTDRTILGSAYDGLLSRAPRDPGLENTE